MLDRQVQFLLATLPKPFDTHSMAELGLCSHLLGLPGAVPFLAKNWETTSSNTPRC